MIKLYQGDCLEVMDKLIEQNVKVDAIITDPPYGTTACYWDSVIPFDEMWKRLKLLRNDRTPIVLFGSEPFSSALRMSNIKEYKYDWKWDKAKGSNYATVKYMPFKNYEDIIIFFEKGSSYNPQMRVGKLRNKKSYSKGGGVYGDLKSDNKDNFNNLYYPTAIIKFSNADQRNKKHPTQKPVDLMEYLIKTYTNRGDTVLDFTMGSGTTGVACKKLGRKFIGIELDEKYFTLAKERIDETEPIFK